MKSLRTISVKGIFLCLIITIGGLDKAQCQQGNTKETDVDKLFTSAFTALTIPQMFKGEIRYIDPKTKFESTRRVDSLAHDKGLLSSLPIIVSAVTIYQQDAQGALSIAGSSISASSSNYVVLYDFAQSQQISFAQDGLVVNGLIGISVRMTATLHTKKRGVNLASLLGISLAASQNKVTGSIEVKSFGINSQTINELIPVPSDISASSIQTSLSAVATIKSHIYDSATIITPLLLAYNYIGDPKRFKFEIATEKFNSFKQTR